MTKELIEDIREIVLPFLKKRLEEINYEGQGNSDASAIEKDLNTILDMAIQSLDNKDLIRKMKSEIADSLEFWDYSPNNNPLARDILETVNTYCAKMGKTNEID